MAIQASAGPYGPYAVGFLPRWVFCTATGFAVPTTADILTHGAGSGLWSLGWGLLLPARTLVARFLGKQLWAQGRYH